MLLLKHLSILTAIISLVKAQTGDCSQHCDVVWNAINSCYSNDKTITDIQSCICQEDENWTHDISDCMKCSVEYETPSRSSLSARYQSQISCVSQDDLNDFENDLSQCNRVCSEVYMAANKCGSYKNMNCICKWRDAFNVNIQGCISCARPKTDDKGDVSADISKGWQETCNGASTTTTAASTINSRPITSTDGYSDQSDSLSSSTTYSRESRNTAKTDSLDSTTLSSVSSLVSIAESTLSTDIDSATTTIGTTTSSATTTPLPRDEEDNGAHELSNSGTVIVFLVGGLYIFS